MPKKFEPVLHDGEIWLGQNRWTKHFPFFTHSTRLTNNEALTLAMELIAVSEKWASERQR